MIGVLGCVSNWKDKSMLDWCIEAIVAEGKWLIKWLLPGEEVRVRLLRSIVCGVGAAMRHNKHEGYTMIPMLSARTRSWQRSWARLPGAPNIGLLTR